MNITIAQKKYILKHGYAAFFMFEDIAGKPVEQAETLRELITLFYCMLKAYNEEFTYSFDAFVELLDSEEVAVSQFSTYMATLKSVSPEKKKKVTR